MHQIAIYLRICSKNRQKCRTTVFFIKNFRIFPDVSKCIWMHPNASKCIQTGLSMFKNFKNLREIAKASKKRLKQRTRNACFSFERISPRPRTFAAQFEKNKRAVCLAPARVSGGIARSTLDKTPHIHIRLHRCLTMRTTFRKVCHTSADDEGYGRVGSMCYMWLLNDPQDLRL